MQPTAHVAGIVGGVIALLLIATVVLAVTRRFKLPFMVVLVLVVISLVALTVVYPHVLPTRHSLEISSALIFHVFLPTLTVAQLDFDRHVCHAGVSADTKEMHDVITGLLSNRYA